MLKQGSIHINKPYTDSSIDANNGITNNAGTLQLGGTLIKNTTLAGAFSLSMTSGSASFAVGTSGSATHKLRCLNDISTATDGTAAGLFQTTFAPAADVSGTTNVYGAVGTLDLNLDNFSINTATAVNIAGNLASLVLRKSAAQSTGILCASRATLNIYDDVNAADVRIYNAKAPEVSGAGAAITNLYGFYIEAQKIAAVTNAWGVYQVGANDINYFGGVSRFNQNIVIGAGMTIDTANITQSNDTLKLNCSGGTLFRNINGTAEFGRITSTSLLLTVPVQPPTIADASAPNNSIYFSSTASKLVYKDSGGVVNALY